MLVEWFPHLSEYKFIKTLRSFYRSYAYIAVIVLLMVLSELFSLELFCFYSYLILCGAGLLLSEDALPLVPVIVCCYMTISAKNNPAAFPETSVFHQTAFRVQFTVIIAASVVLLFVRLATAIARFPRSGCPRLSVGFALLGAGYVLGGSFSGHYAADTALLGFVEIVSLCVFYFYFYYTVRWSETNAAYVLAVIVMLGFGMMCQVAGMYMLEGVIANGVVTRHAMFTGWGTYNNVGCIMELCIAAPFYFAIKRRNGWIYTVIGTLFLLATLASQSRAAMLCGSIIYLACVVAVLYKTKGRERLYHLVVFAALAATAVVMAFVLSDEFLHFFASVVHEGMGDNGRFQIYRDCINDFLSAPVFGVGFYATHGHREWLANIENPFLPPRAHNTYIQLLASGGIFALGCYLVHRVQTVLLVMRRPTTEKTMIALCASAILLTSLFDCHFFNFGPGLLYGVLLVFAEKEDAREGVLPKRQRAGTA